MAETEGRRERKRRETRQRIIDAGLTLFREKGIEATTLDEIAAIADISRRSFFSYFPAKEDIVLAWQDGADEALRDAVIAAAPGREPLAAVEEALRSLAPLFATHDFLELDKLMQSTETLKAKKERHFEHQTESLFETLTAIWPEPSRRKTLEVTAMVAIGCLKIGAHTWMAEGGRRDILDCLDEAFATLRRI